MAAQLLGLAEAAARIGSGSTVGITALSPMALIREIVARGVTNLHVIGVPTGGLAIDLLIGAGRVHTVEMSAVQLGESGFAPHFSRAAVDGSVHLRDST